MWVITGQKNVLDLECWTFSLQSRFDVVRFNRSYIPSIIQEDLSTVDGLHSESSYHFWVTDSRGVTLTMPLNETGKKKSTYSSIQVNRHTNDEGKSRQSLLLGWLLYIMSGLTFIGFPFYLSGGVNSIQGRLSPSIGCTPDTPVYPYIRPLIKSWLNGRVI